MTITGRVRSTLIQIDDSRTKLVPVNTKMKSLNVDDRTTDIHDFSVGRHSAGQRDAELATFLHYINELLWILVHCTDIRYLFYYLLRSL